MANFIRPLARNPRAKSLTRNAIEKSDPPSNNRYHTPMSARALLAMTWLSALLCVAIAALWVRGYLFYDVVHYFPQQTSGIAASSAQGELQIYYLNSFPVPWPTTFGLQSNRTTSAPFPPRHRSIFDSIFSFQWFDHFFPSSTNPTSPKYHVRSFAFPIWSPFVLSAALPIWAFFRGRRKKRWQFRKDVRWINPRLQSRVARFALFSAVGGIAGFILAGLEIAFRIDRTDGGEYLAFAVLLPIVCLLVILTRRRIPFHKALLWISLEIAGAVCFFNYAAERAFICFRGWGYLFRGDDGPTMVFLLWLTIFLGCAILLFFFQLKPEPVKPGPYCPQCGYCLIGSPRQICSECGRPFTHDELGVTPEALIPSAAPPLTTG
jgi:hypothetical protein